MRKELSFLWNCMQEEKTRLCGILLLGIIDIGLALFIVGVTRRLIDVASGAHPGIWWQELILLSACILFSVLVRGLYSLHTVWLQNKLQNRLLGHFFSRLLHAEWLAMKKYHSGDVMSRMETDVDGVVNLLVTAFPQFVLTALKLCGAFLFLYNMDGKLALILAALIPVILLLSKLYVKKMRRLSRLLKEQGSGVRQFFQEAVQSREIVKALRAESLMEIKLDGLQAELLQTVRRQSHFSFYSNTVVMSGFAVGYLITFSWGLFRLENGTITFGSLMAFLQLVNMIQGPALGLAQLVPGFITSYTATERLEELDDLPAEKSVCHRQLVNISCIEFQDVSFSYREGGSLLEGLDWKFECGKMYALTGKTGCGKTTVIRLLLAFVRPDTGKIVLTAGLQHIEVNVDTRIDFTYVSQDCFLFSGSIRDNLRMGCPQATDEDMAVALQRAAAGFVFGLPEGMDTRVNERGEGLSGGQVQRLAIARALLVPGSVLLLDEFTSALDAGTEYEVVASLKRNVKDRIIIIVSHKQKVIDTCDCVYRL